MIQFKYLEEYVYIQCMIHSALCVCKWAVTAKPFARIPEYLDRVHKCSVFAHLFMPLSFELEMSRRTLPTTLWLLGVLLAFSHIKC